MGRLCDLKEKLCYIAADFDTEMKTATESADEENITKCLMVNHEGRGGAVLAAVGKGWPLPTSSWRQYSRIGWPTATVARTCRVLSRSSRNMILALA